MFALGLLLLLLGADSVVRGASGLGQRLGLSPFAAGLLLVASATSIPELVINAYAFQHGQTDLALGNAVGSNIVNIGLTLGGAAVVAPLLIRMRLLAAQIVFVLVASGIVLLFGLDGSIARWEGGVLLAGFAGVVGFVVLRSPQEGADVRKEISQYAVTSTNLVQNLVRLGFAAALLFIGSRLVVGSAPVIGLAMGMGPMLTGVTLVAVGTALPEMVAAMIAAGKGQGDVVAGQVLGACLFNLLFIVGGMAVIRPLPLPASFVGFELPAAMAFALLLYPLLGGDLKISRREGSGLLLAFVAWLAFEVFTALA